MLLCEDLVKFAVFRNRVEAIVKVSAHAFSRVHCVWFFLPSYLDRYFIEKEKLKGVCCSFDYSIYPSLITSNLLSQLRQISTLLAAQS